MSKHVLGLSLNRIAIIFAMLMIWILGGVSLWFFYLQQISGYEKSIHEQINQRVSMTSGLQAELIDKEFTFFAANLIQIGELSMEAPEQVSKFAERLKSLNPTIWQIYIADSNGKITFSTKDGYQPSISVRDYFTEHTKNQQRRFFISSPRQSVIQESALYVAMSYPVFTPYGQFVGVVVARLKSEDLTNQLGNITRNNNISAVLTDHSGKLIWSSNMGDEHKNSNIYSLCKNNTYQASTEYGIHRIKLFNNARCEAQFLEKWEMFSIVAENRIASEATIQLYQQQMLNRNVIILFVFTLLLIMLSYLFLKQAESRKIVSVLNQRNKAIIDAMPDLLLTIKNDGTIIDHEVQDNFPLLVPSDKLNGMNIRDLMEPELVNRKLSLITQTIQTGEPATTEYPLTVNGTELYFLERLTALDDKHVLAFIIDITSRREAECKLEWQAYHDGLTGLANRLMFFEFLNKLIQDYRRNKREFTILFIDLNGFKEINDNYGHHAGDEMLRHVSHRLNTSLRQTDTVARLGGDEFAVLLPETSPDQTRQVIKIIEATVQQPLDYFGSNLSVTASIGMAACPHDALSADELLNIADKRMYGIKSTNP